MPQGNLEELYNENKIQQLISIIQKNETAITVKHPKMWVTLQLYSRVFILYSLSLFYKIWEEMVKCKFNTQVWLWRFTLDDNSSALHAQLRGLTRQANTLSLKWLIWLLSLSEKFTLFESFEQRHFLTIK